LTIINLLGAYAYTYDENRLDDFRALFTESPQLLLLREGCMLLSAPIDVVMNLLAVRKEAFKPQNNQRRHALNCFWFASQSANEATGHCHVQVFAIQDGGPPNPELTGRNEFTAVEQTGCGGFLAGRISEAGPGASLENIKGRIDVGHDRRTVTAHQLPERAGDVRTDGAGSEDFLGQDDAIYQVGGTKTAVWSDLIPPVADLDSLRLRSEKAPPRRGEDYSRKSAKHLDHQPNSPGTGQGHPDRAADPIVVEAGHQSPIGKTNEGVMV
jgi:hypothetical protein